MRNPKAFLGGTCNGSTWRDELIELLEIDYFNPVVEDWNEETQREEKRQKEICDYCLYVITPLMTGMYAIAEVVDDSNKRPDKAIMCILTKDGDKEFTKSQIGSLKAVADLVEENGAKVFRTLKDVSLYLNKYKEK